MQTQISTGFRLSPSQKRLWSLHQNSSAFCSQIAISMRGPLAPSVLNDALQRILDRHEVLRTTFNYLPGWSVPVQTVVDCVTALWREVDLRGLSSDELHGAIDELFHEESQSPFDLEQGPLFRACLARLSDEDHILFITAPSLCADSKTLANLFNELGRAYADCLQGEFSDDEPVQYVQFSEWQHELSEANDDDEGTEHWRKQDLSALGKLELPLQQTPVDLPEFLPGHIRSVMEADQIKKVEGVADQQGANLGTFLLSCLQVLLWRLTEQESIVIGMLCDGRVYEEMEGGFGLYARWPLVESRFERRSRFLEVLQQTSKAAQDAIDWQEYFFLTESLQRLEGNSADFILPVGFSFEELPDEVDSGDVRFSVLKQSSWTERFKLRVSCVRGPNNCAIDFHYDPAFHSTESVRRFAGEFFALLQSAKEHPERQIIELNILDETERHQLVSAWNETDAEFPSDKTFMDVFEAQVERAPEALAVTFEQERLTYTELNRRANQFANCLQALGVGPEILVGSCVERSVEMIVGVLGILKAGGAYLPLDPALPAERLLSMLNDAGAPVVLTQQKFVTKLEGYTGIVICVDAEDARIETAIQDSPVSLAGPQNMAYVIYTSGSTGKPKGVMIEHRSLMNYLSWVNEVLVGDRLSALPLVTELSFDASLKQMLAPLLRGDAVWAIPAYKVVEPAMLVDELCAKQKAGLNCVPSLWSACLNASLSAGASRLTDDFTTLFVGGEQISKSLIERTFDALPQIQMWNLYGPTEATANATFARILPDEPVTIGRPLSNSRVYVVDASMNAVPVGVPGEMLIGGVGVARGYLGRPELTAERFVPDAEGGEAGARVYRTGDLVRRLSDGRVEYLGRIDEQVKVRGYRIELGEVESVLAEVGGVKQAAVVAVGERDEEKRLVAYVVEQEGGQRSSVSEMRKQLSQRLPDYMVPSSFVRLDRLPLTGSGKVDRRKLQETKVSEEREGEYVGGRTPVEETLEAIWSQVLGKQKVSRGESFFEVGGHSLLATQLISRVREVMKVELHLRDLFEGPTIEEMGRKIEEEMRGGRGVGNERIRRAERGEEIPLSFAQQRLWFIDQLQPGNSVYNIPVALTITGPLDVPALERSINEVVSRHEALRTTFSSRAGRPVQVIADSLTIHLPVIDLTQLERELAEQEAKAIASQEAGQGFDLQEGPLVRCKAVRLGEREYGLVMSVHHIVSDGWSMGLLVGEVARIYEREVGGDSGEMEELEIQYADYAIWQRGWMSGEVLERHLSYWREQLAEAVPVLNLPYDRPRPAIQTYRGALQFFTLPKPVTESLKRLSQQQGATLFMTLMAAFKALLYRYTAQLDISVGTPISNRNRIELERLIGFCVNTLVLRTRLSSDLSFLDLLDRVREVALQGYAHQDLPFEHLIDSLQLERDLSHTPLFQVMMVLQNAPASTIQLSDLTMSPMEVDIKTAKFDMVLNFAESGDELAGTLEYNTDLFDDKTIERLLANFQTLINSIIAEPDLRISELPLLAGTELQQLVGEWNEAKEYPDRHNLIHEAFQVQAERRPGDIAVVCGDAALTYRELNNRANQLAHYLRRQGVGPEALVGICVERSVEMIVGLLGILKAGGAYVPMEPSHPRDALAYMLEDARISVLLTQEHLAEQLPEHAATTIYLDSDWRLIGQEAIDDLPSEASSSNVAYVIYTSGSTGKPKGALITHSNITRLLGATHDWFLFDHRDVWTMFHSYAFDFSVWEIWGALAYGGRLVVVPHWVTRTPEAFYEVVVREGVTVLNQTPSAFQQLIRAEEEQGGGAGELSLRLVIFGGEALEFQSLSGWMRRHGDERPLLVNMYGITETTVHVTYRPIKRSDLSEPVGSRIGRQIPDLQMFVMDQQWQLAPIGVPGEIFVGGDGLARGYLNRFELTSERFIPNPFSRNAGARLYRTGDLGRYLPGGEIEYLGRIDHQVKIRGFRIELEEIEAALNALPGVRESLVIDHADESGEKRLVAYVVSTQEGPRNVSQLRASLKESLPEYMIPSAFLQLEAFPLTVNGKIDRRALPVPGAARPELEAGFVPPRTPVEEVLAAIWGQVLGVDRIGIDDNYFALGGDSIRSIQVRALAQQRELDFSLQDLFQSQTIRRLAQGRSFTSEKEKIRTSPFSLISEIDRERLPAGVEDAYPLVRLQSGMLFHGEYHNNASLYHNVASVHLRAPFDADAMEIAARRLLDRHAVLRTSFDLSSYSEPLQLIHEEVATPLFVDDLRHLTSEEQDKALADWLAAEKARHFDWRCAPLLRFNVHRRSDDSFQFTLTEHHAILDGWSVASMLTELFRTYLSLATRKGNDAGGEDEPALSYRDYVALEREALQSEEFINYWKETLEEAYFTPLPRLPDPTQDPGAAQMVVEGVEITPETTEGLFKLARTCGVPFKSVLLAAHMRVMRLLSGVSDVNTGLVMNGRPETEDGERVLGLFLNAVLFRMNMPGGTWVNLIKQTFDKEMEILPYRRYPMADLQRKKGGQSLFDSAFTYTHFHVYERLQEFNEIEVLGGDTYAETNFPIQASFDLHSATGELRLALHANVHDLGYEQIRRIGKYYERTLETMASNPTGYYESVNLLSEDEEQELLFDFNNTQALYAKPQTLSQLFEEQVEKTNDEIAVLCGNRSLTYGELNSRANKVANYLTSLGVGPEVVVALSVERSLEMVVGLLGILKAGAAYLPIDPSLPLDRIAFILEDSSARAVLTQESVLERLPAFWGETISLDGEWEQISNHSDSQPDPELCADNLAYIIYTSGSTGSPKGVMVTHRGMVNYLNWAVKAYGAAEVCGSVVHSAIGFDLTVTSLYVPLLAGKAVEMLSGEDSVEELSRGVTSSREGVLVKATPTQVEMMAEQVKARGEQAKASVYVIGGEALRAELVDKLREVSGEVKIYNEYGPTETVVGCSVKEVEEREVRGEVSIGRPIGNARMYVMDEEQRVMPVGVVGEIYIGGAGLARGYLGRGDKTAEVFVPDSVSGEAGGRLYRSGDVGRYTESGEIEYVGRRDEQVKVRGYRIELGEVESVMKEEVAGIKEVVVVAQGEGIDRRLVAYIVRGAGEEIKVGEVRRKLEERMPGYMVPARYVMLERMPLTRNGKVDRKALPAPDESRPELEREFAAPRNEIERGLAEVWSGVLGINPIGINDNFFDLGGDSLLAMQIVVRVRELFLVDINVMRLFELPTIAAFAEAIEASVIEPKSRVVTTTQPIRRRSRNLEEQLAELSQVSDEEVNALVDSSI